MQNSHKFYPLQLNMPTKRKPPNQPVKGQAIRIVGGKYVGKNGWLDIANKARSTTKVCIIVHVVTEGQLSFPTSVDATNLRYCRKEPATWAEAAVMQQPKLEQKMMAMVKHFAACDMEGHEESVCALLKRELGESMKIQNTTPGAKWYKVRYTEG